MTSLLSAEISATCNALGYFDENTNKYYADSNTLETAKDIIRYLRRDDDNHTIRRQIGASKVLITDLLPLLKHYHEKDDLFDVLLRLVMNLTTPPLLLFNFEVPTNKTDRNYYLELEDHLKSYKEAFVDEGIWAVFSMRLSKILDVDNFERGDENGLKIERILVLIRNIMFVPADSIEKRPDNDASIHDQVLWALHHSGLLDIILYITTNPSEQGYYMYILEIMFFMFKGQQPNELAVAALQRSEGEKIRDEAELVNMRHTESNEKQKKIKKYTGSRHSRFGGTFVVASMKSISDNDVISHKPIDAINSLNFDANKRKRKTPKNKTPLVYNAVDRRSAFTIRLFLKEFCIEFLNGAYNSLMQHIKSILVRNSGDNHDESYYFWALSFFMAFNRHYKFEVKLISETLAVQTFYYIQQQSENYLDMMKTQKKKILIWTTRLHTALLAYKELLSTLFLMDNSKDKVLKESSKVIKGNIFYIPEYREFVLSLLMMYDELKMTNVYLNDLMETQHLFIKMFENYCKQEGNIVVKKKTRSKGKRKSTVPSGVSTIELDLDELWDKAGPQLSVILESGDFLTDTVPFDAASEIPIDEQKSNAMEKIQFKMRQSEYESAIGIMRAAREVWPENNSFGSDNMTSEEEFLALREIFYADFGANKIPGPDAAVEENYDNASDEEEDYDDNPPRDQEVTFNFKDFQCRLLKPTIVRTCALALRSFETNSVNTNHAILKLMHRIAFDCKSYVMLFQLSLFRTFQKIFSVKDLPQYKELVKFAIFIMRNFFKTSETNDKVFIEALFWTQNKETYEIEYGYGSVDTSAAVSKLWSEEEENELHLLFQEYNDKQITDDVVDWIGNNLVNNTRSRRMVLKKLKELNILDNRKQRKIHSAKSLLWTEEEDEELKDLYSESKDLHDPIGIIMTKLTRPKKHVIDRLKLHGLIHDKVVPKRKKNIGQRKKQTIANDGLLTELLDRNISAGRQNALDWLMESISDLIEDFEEDHEGIPLVPLLTEVDDALETTEFQELLKGLGFSEPYDEQEIYWRIPNSISLDTLKSHRDIIQSSLENGVSANKNPNDCENASNTPTSVRDDDSSNSEDTNVFDQKESSSNNDNVNIYETEINSSKEGNVISDSRRRISSSSSEDDSPHFQRKRLRLLSD